MRSETMGQSGIRTDVQARTAAVVVTVLLGVFLLWGVGFAQPDMLHNAAHDARHAFSFPCH
jgi:cobalt transporter subunit CbtB